MSDKNHDQQKFDSTLTRVIIKGAILETTPLNITVEQISSIINLIKNGEEALEELEKVQCYCRINSIPGDFKVRTGRYKPMEKDSTTRGGAGALTPMTPRRRAKKTVLKTVAKVDQIPKKGVAEKALLVLKRKKGAASVAEIAKKLGLAVGTVGYGIGRLVETKRARRRKARKSEKATPTTKYVYEAVA